ncbi:MAG TPA: hypothetical protein VGF67_13875 [Ktedonobacteraceae bacterium]
MMKQLHRFFSQDPPALATDGLGAYREALLSTWGKIPPWCGHGRPPTRPQPNDTWKYLQIIKKRKGSKMVDIRSKGVYGDPEDVRKMVGEQTSYVERTHLTSRQMNGRWLSVLPGENG